MPNLVHLLERQAADIERLQMRVESLEGLIGRADSGAAGAGSPGALDIGSYTISDRTADYTDDDGAVWMLCNGDAISRTTYSDYFTLVGTRWGVGDGSTTFNVADCRDRYVVMAGSEMTIGDTDGNALGARSPESHEHTDTFSVDNDTHGHDVSGSVADNSVTIYDHGTQATDGPSATINVPYDIGATPGSGTHTHNCQGYSHYVEDHGHTSGSLAADNDTHNHGVSGSVDSKGTWPPHACLNLFVRVA